MAREAHAAQGQAGDDVQLQVAEGVHAAGAVGPAPGRLLPLRQHLAAALQQDPDLAARRPGLELAEEDRRVGEAPVGLVEAPHPVQRPFRKPRDGERLAHVADFVPADPAAAAEQRSAKLRQAVAVRRGEPDARDDNPPILGSRAGHGDS